MSRKNKLVSIHASIIPIVAAIAVILLAAGGGIQLPSVLAAPPKSPLQSETHVTVQNTTTSVQDPLPGHQGHQLALILPPRSDGKVWVGTVTWTSSKPVELVVLHGYTNVTSADAAHGVPLKAPFGSGAVAITLIAPSQSGTIVSGPVPSGSVPFAGTAVALHTLSGQRFTATYTVDATANSLTKTK
jgi:hypothetical protein